MNYIYMLAGTFFALALVAQMMAFAAHTKKARVRVEKSYKDQP